MKTANDLPADFGALPDGFTDPRDARIAELEAALRACIGNAGVPDPLAACLAVIATAKDALGEK